MIRMAALTRTLLVLGALAWGLTGCDEPGEADYNIAQEFKTIADQSEDEAVRAENYGKAIEHLKIALEADPRNVDYLRKIASVYKNQAQFIKAIEYYDKAIQSDPDEGRNYYDKMRMMIRANQFEQAELFYERSMTLDVVRRDPKTSQHMNEQLSYLRAERERVQLATQNQDGKTTEPAKNDDDE